MPNWKKVIVSGSSADLANITASNAILTNIANAGTDTDKFLVLDSSDNVDFRTGTQVLSDIGATSCVGTVTSIATTSPITGGTITSTGTIGITQANTSTDGYLSSTDWNTFNNKTTCTGTVDTSGTPVDNDFAKFTDANTIEGRNATEMRSDLNVADGATACTGTVTSVTSGDVNTITIGGTATDPTVAVCIGTIVGDNQNLATGDQIFSFVTGQGYTCCTGDITGVTAGNGLTGGATSGNATLNIGAGTGIDVSADAIAVDVSDFMSNGANNRIVTATGADAMNAEANLTFDGTTLAVGTKLTVGSSQTNSGTLSSIAGGTTNTVSSACSFIGGGQQNIIASGIYSTIAGGNCNTVAANAVTIAGGQRNSGSAEFSTIGGGFCNISSGGFATIVGGRDNSTAGGCSYIGGGCTHDINNNSCFAVIVGGNDNTINNSCCSFIGGGRQNCICAQSANGVIVGGWSNLLDSSACCSGILGGYNNTLSHNNSFIVGSSLTSTATCYTFMNNACIAGTTRTTTLVETSAKKHKECILPLQDQIKNIQKLKPVNFQWKENNKKDIGFIAEQVKEVYPDLVSYEENGEIHGVQYSKLTTVLVKALQQQQEQIEELKKEIFIIKNNLNG